MTFLSKLSAARIVPVIRHGDSDVARRGGTLLLENGFSVIEVTLTVPGAAAVIADLVLRHTAGTVGAGTLLTAEDTRQVIDSGASFVVSPCWVDEVAAVCADAGVPYLPGAMTPKEIVDNWRGGATVVKIFPAREAGGVGFLRAVKSVFPEISMMPTGGVSAAETQTFIDAGAVCVGAGSELFPAHALEGGKDDEAIGVIRRARAASLA